jgi:hypothetical protein
LTCRILIEARARKKLRISKTRKKRAKSLGKRRSGISGMEAKIAKLLKL